jgi:hypothetical protein
MSSLNSTARITEASSAGSTAASLLGSSVKPKSLSMPSIGTSTTSESARSSETHIWGGPQAPAAIRNLIFSAYSSDRLLQKWRGTVLSIQNDDVTARLVDETNTSHPVEIVVLSSSEFDDEDRPLIVPGAVFYLSIRYEQSRGRPRQRVTRLRIRRLPGFSSSDVTRAKAAATAFRSTWE